MHLIDKLELLRRTHYECDDCWYSCPLSPEGCCKDDEVGCNCGAQQSNALLNEIIAEITDDWTCP